MRATLGPQVKFGNIHSSASFDFPNKTVSPQVLSSAIRQAFPRSVVKRCGHDRATHVFGIEELPKDIDSPNVHDVLQQNAQLQEENVQLKQKVKQLEDRVCELEQKCDVYQQCSREMQQLVFPEHFVFHGPNTVDSFRDFSMELYCVKSISIHQRSFNF